MALESLDDKVLKDVAERMQQQEEGRESAIDPRLERLAMGAMDSRERDALYVEASEDPELLRKIRFYEPISDLARERYAGRVLVLTKAVPSGAAKRMLNWGCVGLALAASLLLFFFPSASFPAYSISFYAGDSSMRGQALGETRSMHADSQVSIVFTPVTAVDGLVEGRLFIQRGGEWVRSVVGPEVSAAGAVRWRGTAQALSGVKMGSVEFLAIVGRPADLPKEPWKEAASSDWHQTRLRVWLVPGDAP